jgi:hypothetical protein
MYDSKSLVRVILAALVCATTAPVLAGENVTYAYDQLGRLTKVARTKQGDTAPPVTTDFTHDKTGNRQKVKVTGAINGGGDR